MWQCLRPGVANAWLYFFVADGQAPALVDPGALAQETMGKMALAVPVIHMAPEPPGQSYVGLRTWLWIDAAQFDTLTQTATAGATSVMVTATPVRATWDLTEGTTTCGSAGRPWRRGMTDAEQTDCSYVFETISTTRPSGTFPVTATLTYQADWTCSGACLAASGTLGEVPSLPGASTIRVGERQSVVVR